MKIRDLKDAYPLIYEAALRYQEAAGNDRDDSVDLGQADTQAGFTWTSSPEGGTFWHSVYCGEFEKAKAECPHLFEKKESDTHTIEVLPPGTCVFLLEQKGKCAVRIGTGKVAAAKIDGAGCVRYLIKQGAVERYIDEDDVYSDFNEFYEKVKEVCSNYKIIELQQKNEQ